MTYIVHNNQIYGLTKGQASPTSDKGFITRTTLVVVVGRVDLRYHKSLVGRAMQFPHVVIEFN
jgi:pyruvate/2-oxoacid:ferredoxin oxidoreductase beta subunit